MADAKPAGRPNSGDIYQQLAQQSGVSADDVRRVLSALGVDRRLEAATRLTGKAPSASDLRLGFKISEGTVMV